MNEYGICWRCGTQIEEGMNFCPKCGNKVNVNNMPLQMPNSGSYTGAATANHCIRAEIGSGSVYEINGVKFDIKDIQKKTPNIFVANISKKVRKLCKCDQLEAERIVYGYFLSMRGDYSENYEILKDKIEHIKSYNGKKLYCPYCLSRNIDIRQTISESVSKGSSEVRKKSAVTRAGNKVGRAGMIMMTGGLWALTPKKSKYNEVNKTETTYHTTTTKTCMDCGRRIT